jgi:hypothetical protein
MKIRAWRPLATQLSSRDMNSADRQWALDPSSTTLAHVGASQGGRAWAGWMLWCPFCAPACLDDLPMTPQRGQGRRREIEQVECGQVGGCEAPSAPA